MNNDIFESELNTDKRYSKEQILRMWPQSRGELSGFHNALNNGNAGLTAAQLRMALQLAEIGFDKTKSEI